MNFGRNDAGPWPGYTPAQHTLDVVTPRQREILTNSAPVWRSRRFDVRKGRFVTAPTGNYQLNEASMMW